MPTLVYDNILFFHIFANTGYLKILILASEISERMVFMVVDCVFILQNVLTYAVDFCFMASGFSIRLGKIFPTLRV